MGKRILTAEQAAASRRRRAQHLEDAVRALLESEGWARWCPCAVYPPHSGTGRQRPSPAPPGEPNRTSRPLFGGHVRADEARAQAPKAGISPGRKRPPPDQAGARKRPKPGQAMARKVKVRNEPGGIDWTALRVTTYSDPPSRKRCSLRPYAPRRDERLAFTETKARSVSVTSMTSFSLLAPPAMLTLAVHELPPPRHCTVLVRAWWAWGVAPAAGIDTI